MSTPTSRNRDSLIRCVLALIEQDLKFIVETNKQDTMWVIRLHDNYTIGSKRLHAVMDLDSGDVDVIYREGVIYVQGMWGR